MYEPNEKTIENSDYNSASQREEKGEEITENKNYDDELVAAKNYYKEDENECGKLEKDFENAPLESGFETQEQAVGADLAENENGEDVLAPFAKEPDGYYLSVKSEIDELFQKFPKDGTLKETFPASEWIRVEKDGEYQLVGVIYKDWKAQYICYALPTDTPDAPPEEIAEICVFVPVSPFDNAKGHFVIFQSAATGECIKPKDA